MFHLLGDLVPCYPVYRLFSTPVHCCFPFTPPLAPPSPHSVGTICGGCAALPTQLCLITVPPHHEPFQLTSQIQGRALSRYDWCGLNKRFRYRANAIENVNKSSRRNAKDDPYSKQETIWAERKQTLTESRRIPAQPSTKWQPCI